MRNPAPHRPIRPALGVEALELRDVPAASLVEPFQRGPVADLPAGWLQWSSDGTRSFKVDPTAAGLGDTGPARLGRGRGHRRPGLGVRPVRRRRRDPAAVYLNSTVPVQLFVRGQNLGTTTPTYYAASVTRGGGGPTLRVVAGRRPCSAPSESAEYVSNRWVQVKLRAEGDTIRVTLHRGDTNQYLGPDGKWVRELTAAVIEVGHRDPRPAGRSGSPGRPGRPGRSAWTACGSAPAADTRRATLAEERFDQPPAAGLPAGWSQWVAGAGR